MSEMSGLIPTLGLAVLAALVYGLLHKVSPPFALLFSMAAGVFLLVRLAAVLQGVVQGIEALAGQVNSEAFRCLLQCAGILLLTDYAGALCDEAGAESLAWCTSLAGRVLMLAALWPLLEEVCGLIWELTG